MIDEKKCFKTAQVKDYPIGKDVLYDHMMTIGFEGNNCVKRTFLDMFIKCRKDGYWKTRV